MEFKTATPGQPAVGVVAMSTDTSGAAAGSGSNAVGANSVGAPERLILARTYANTRDTLTLAARGIGGSATVYAALNYEEQH